jgi:cysteine desulfurase
MKRIYLDHAATTPLDPEVLREMGPYFSQDFGNPSSVYAEGQRGREAIDDARQEIARILECSLEEIIFVSSATEGNNFALKGVLEAWRKSHKGLPHLITSSIEHSSVLTTAELLAENGQAEVTFLPVTNEGLLRPEDLKAALQENTALVSLQYVNNEIGAIQPISRLGKICAKSNIPFHVDAVQGAGIVPLSV